MPYKVVPTNTTSQLMIPDPRSPSGSVVVTGDTYTLNLIKTYLEQRDDFVLALKHIAGRPGSGGLALPTALLAENALAKYGL